MAALLILLIPAGLLVAVVQIVKGARSSRDETGIDDWKARAEVRDHIEPDEHGQI